MFCNYPNKLLNSKELKRIEIYCKNCNQLNNFESLKNIILNDEKKLESKQITFDQIKSYIESLKLYIKKKASVKIFHEHKVNIIDRKKNFLKDIFGFEKKKDKNFNLEIKNSEINEYTLLNYIEKNVLLEYINNTYGYQFTMFGSNYLVKIIEYNNLEYCPFDSNDDNFVKYEHIKSDFLIYNLDKKLCICLNTLIIHQITTHHFFQSPSNPNRIEPFDLIEIFDLKPKINYKIKIKEIKYYPFCSANSLNEEELIKILYEILKTPDYILSLISKLDGKLYYHIKLKNFDYKKKIILNNIEFEKTNFSNTYYNLDKIKKYIEIDE